MPLPAPVLATVIAYMQKIPQVELVYVANLRKPPGSTDADFKSDGISKNFIFLTGGIYFLLVLRGLILFAVSLKG